MRILIADDETDILNALKTIFERNNYIVDTVADGRDAFEYGMTGNYDGIVLDIMMPYADGVEVLKKLRANGVSTPVLLLTAKSEVSDRVSGLDAGADDYLPKPFAVSELLARVRAMLRRKEDFTPDIIDFNGMKLDKSTYELTFGVKKERLVGREFQIMEMLMQNPGRIISTDRFMEHIWGWDSNVEVSIVWVNISNLRKKIASVGAPVEIRAVRGVGYCMEKSE